MVYCFLVRMVPGPGNGETEALAVGANSPEILKQGLANTMTARPAQGIPFRMGATEVADKVGFRGALYGVYG